MPPLFVLPVLLLFATAHGYPPACSNATCGDQTIAYPFWLNSSSASSCGYPGLGLACENNTTLLLVDQSHHRYRVSGIDYDTHTVSLVDDAQAFNNTTSCPLLHFNLTIDATSPLHLTSSDSNITFFYNCTKNGYWPSAVELSGCPGYSRSSYVFLGDGYTHEAYEYGCDVAVVAPVLNVHKKSMAEVPPERRYADVLMGGFELNYSPQSEQCGICERSGGWCGYRHNQTNGWMGLTCFCDGGPTTDKCENTLAKIAKTQSSPMQPPATDNDEEAPPLLQPGTRPLGWARDFSAAPSLRKILPKRIEKLEQTLLPSTARPPLWPWIAAAVHRRRLENTAGRGISRSPCEPRE